MSQDELGEISRLWVEIERLKHTELPLWVYPTSPSWAGTAGSPLTSTSWDGDARSTTAKTLIDLSAVFSVPAGAKAVAVKIGIRDSGSAASASGCYLVLSHESASPAAGGGASCAGLANDALVRIGMLVIPCDANGDIYYEVDASGASTLDAWLEIWGYLR
jgi:hypothetical protein